MKAHLAWSALSVMSRLPASGDELADEEERRCDAICVQLATRCRQADDEWSKQSHARARCGHIAWLEQANKGRAGSRGRSPTSETLTWHPEERREDAAFRIKDCRAASLVSCVCISNAASPSRQSWMQGRSAQWHVLRVRVHPRVLEVT